MWANGALPRRAGDWIAEVQRDQSSGLSRQHPLDEKAVLLRRDGADERHPLVEDDGGQRGDAEPGDGLGVVVQDRVMRLAARAVAFKADHVEPTGDGQAPQYIGPSDVEIVAKVSGKECAVERRPGLSALPLGGLGGSQSRQARRGRR